MQAANLSSLPEQKNGEHSIVMLDPSSGRRVPVPLELQLPKIYSWTAKVPSKTLRRNDPAHARKALDQSPMDNAPQLRDLHICFMTGGSDYAPPQ